MENLNFIERFVCKILSHANVPNHLAFIMDGNRRYATKLGKKKIQGHQYGFESLKKSLAICETVGIKIVTLFAFALQNFNRPSQEVDYLMNLVLIKFQQLSKKQGFFEQKQIKVKVIGDKAKLPQDVAKCFQDVQQTTKKFTKLKVNVCFAYNSDYQIEETIKSIPKPTSLKQFLNSLMISQFPDIIVRTSNQIRLSNFLTIQSMKSQLCFLQQNWPQISIISFLRILIPYHINYEEAKEQQQLVDKQIQTIK